MPDPLALHCAELIAESIMGPMPTALPATIPFEVEVDLLPLPDGLAAHYGGATLKSLLADLGKFRVPLQWQPEGGNGESTWKFARFRSLTVECSGAWASFEIGGV